MKQQTKRISDGPYYIVVENTNLRQCARALNDGDSNIYDTIELARVAIDANEDSRRQCGIPKYRVFVPISVAEYDEKYSKPMKSDDRTLRVARDANKALRVDVADRDGQIDELIDEIKKLKADAKDAHAIAGVLIGNQARRLLNCNRIIDGLKSEAERLRDIIRSQKAHDAELLRIIRVRNTTTNEQKSDNRELRALLTDGEAAVCRLLESGKEKDETIRAMRNTNGVLDRNRQDLAVRLDRVRDVVDASRGRSFQAIVERISDIIREDEL